MTSNGKFSRRFNLNGTVDSICRECFVTVATTQQESELPAKEQLHSCNPKLVEWYHRSARELDIRLSY